jgi:hypothetical protein
LLQGVVISKKNNPALKWISCNFLKRAPLARRSRHIIANSQGLPMRFGLPFNIMSGLETHYPWPGSPLSTSQEFFCREVASIGGGLCNILLV